MSFTPSERDTSSNGPVNLESRSRIRNRRLPNRSPSARLRACCVTHAGVGVSGDAAVSTRRDGTSIAKST